MKTEKDTHSQPQQSPEQTSPHLGLLKRINKKNSVDFNEIVITALEQTNFSAAAIHLVNMLAFKLQCDRVSIGVRVGNFTTLCALSNSASFDPKTNFIKCITAAMDESVDEAATITIPSSENSESAVITAHRQLSKQHGNRTICTIPLQHHGHYFGALCLEKTEGNLFDAEQIGQAEKIAQLIGPILYLLHQQQRSVIKRSIDYLHNRCLGLFGPDKIISSITSIVLISLLVFSSLYSVNFRVTSDVVMEGSIQRVVASPVEGYILTANKRAGDTVEAGEQIASLDDKELALKSIQLKSEKRQLQREYRESLAANDRSKVRILNAKSNQLAAKLDLIEEQISRLRLISPIAGIITEGNLNQSIGSPVSRGDVLFKVSPLENYRVIINVDESDISYIENGQHGKLALSALPNTLLDFNVSKITPVASSSDGRTFFRVEALLTKENIKLQPGMEGIGKIAIGERKLIWVLTHGVIDRLRLLLWYFWI